MVLANMPGKVNETCCFSGNNAGNQIKGIKRRFLVISGVVLFAENSKPDSKS